MSLILEALRKLEREKQAPERAVVVMGATQWARHESRPVLRWLLGGLAAGTLVAFGAIGTWFFLRAAPTAQPADLPTPSPGVATPRVSTTASSVLAPAPRVTPRADTPATPAARLAARQGPAPQATPSPESTPPVAPSVSVDARFELQAISERDGEPIAILGGRMVRVGDAFEDVRVLRIGVGEVEIKVAGQRRLLRF